MEATSRGTYRTVNETKVRIKSGHTKVYELLNAGVLRAVKAGSRTLISDESIDAYLASLPAYEPKAAA